MFAHYIFMLLFCFSAFLYGMKENKIDESIVHSCSEKTLDDLYNELTNQMLNTEQIKKFLLEEQSKEIFTEMKEEKKIVQEDDTEEDSTKKRKRDSSDDETEDEETEEDGDYRFPESTFFWKSDGKCLRLSCRKTFTNLILHNLYYCTKPLEKTDFVKQYEIDGKTIKECIGCQDVLKKNQEWRHIVKCNKVLPTYIRCCFTCCLLFRSYDDYNCHILKTPRCKSKKKLWGCPVKGCSFSDKKPEKVRDHYTTHDQELLRLAFESRKWYFLERKSKN